MKKKVSIIIALIVVIAIGGCNYPPQKGKQKGQNNKEVIKIGAILPLTGKLSIIGSGEKKGLLMALDSVKTKYPNKKIELIIEDFHSETKDAVSAANKLISIDRVRAIITSTTSASEAVTPITEKNNIIQFVISPDINILSKSKLNFRVYYNFRTEGNVVNDFIVKKSLKNHMGVAFLAVKYSSIQKEIEQIIIPCMNRHNIEIKSKDFFDIGEKRFNNYIVKVKNLRPSFLFLAPQVNQVELLSNQLYENRVHPSNSLTIICSFTYNWRPSKYIRTLNGYYIASPRYLIEDIKQNKYSIAFYNKFQTIPTFDMLYAYDNLMILAKTLITSKSVEDFVNNFNNNKTYYGASGKIKFIGNNDTDVEIVLTKIENNKQVLYEEN